MDSAGKYSHALTTVLYAAHKDGCDLYKILEHAKNGIIGNSLRPNPLDQSEVIDAIHQAIKEIVEVGYK
ncbi:MAG: hypothetical protein ACIWVG_06835 [Gloeotrichia echinulata HAB0833]